MNIHDAEEAAARKVLEKAAICLADYTEAIMDVVKATSRGEKDRAAEERSRAAVEAFGAIDPVQFRTDRKDHP